MSAPVPGGDPQIVWNSRAGHASCANPPVEMAGAATDAAAADCKSCRRDNMDVLPLELGPAVGRWLEGNSCPSAVCKGRRGVRDHPNLLLRGKPFGGRRPACARSPRQSDSSLSVM